MTSQFFSHAGVRYEVALSVLGAVIAHYSEVIATEHEETTPGGAVIAAAQKAKSEPRTTREDLGPDTDEVVEHVITQYDQRARDLYQ